MRSPISGFLTIYPKILSLDFEYFGRVNIVQENIEVYRAIQQTKDAGKKGALATVVQVFGSSYRREGAKMLIDEEEQVVGMISGGCLEGDVAEVAKQVIHTGKPMMKFYDMDEDLVWGLGLGCPGKVQVYIEPIN